jgi:hypothetical protein
MDLSCSAESRDNFDAFCARKDYVGARPKPPSFKGREGGRCERALCLLSEPLHHLYGGVRYCPRPIAVRYGGGSILGAVGTTLRSIRLSLSSEPTRPLADGVLFSYPSSEKDEIIEASKAFSFNVQEAVKNSLGKNVAGGDDIYCCACQFGNQEQFNLNACSFCKMLTTTTDPVPESFAEHCVCARIAEHVYCLQKIPSPSAETLTNELAQNQHLPDYRLVASFSGPYMSSYLILQKDRKAYISFKGTNPTELNDILTNICALPTRTGTDDLDDIAIHTGFFNQALETVRHVLQDLRKVHER